MAAVLAVGVASAAATPRVEPDVPASAMNTQVGPANNSPQLASDPTTPGFVALANRLDGPDFSCALQVSDDGGNEWVTVNPVPKLPAGTAKCYAPEVAFDRKGTLFYVFVGLHGSGNLPSGAFLATSTDHGQSFSGPHKLLGPLNFGVRMAIDPAEGPSGRMHLVWLHALTDPGLGGFAAPPNPIMSAYSDDGGKTLSNPVQVSDAQRDYVVAPALALGPDHAVHVGYYDLRQDARDYLGVEGPAWPGAWSLVVATSLDGGGHFFRGIAVDDHIRPSRRVMLIFTMPPASLVAGPGLVCAGWTDARRGDDDALARCSSDQGRSFGALRRLNDDASGNGRSQYLPRLSLSLGGRLDAVFLDRRKDINNQFYDVVYTYSTDGGRTFARNIRLNQYPSDSRIGYEYAVRSAIGQFEFGSRLGLLSFADSALAVWPDTHNVSPLRREQDLFATQVTSLPDPASGGLPTLVLVLVALVAVVALTAWAVSRHRRRSRQGA